MAKQTKGEIPQDNPWTAGPGAVQDCPIATLQIFLKGT
jgi:hypothetical protein